MEVNDKVTKVIKQALKFIVEYVGIGREGMNGDWGVSRKIEKYKKLLNKLENEADK